jgi:glycerol-3-phosphate O-acyltransferase/dihydroxyacetone phosphate acyltransferase
MVWYGSGDLRTALTVFFSLPMAMYVSLLILQEGVLELHAALPLMMSLFSKHKQFKKLFDRRQKLVGVARSLVKLLDPQLENELAAYRDSNTSVREPSLFSLRHSSRRLADKMN